MIWRHRLALAALAFAWSIFQSGSVARCAEAPATTRPAQQTEIPVKEVVLFSSGVGYFEHFGTITGDGSTELRFKTDQINDILKSLLLQDLDGGRVGTVSYPSQAPLARTLKSFAVDITANPGMAELLNQLRGAEVAITAGDQHLSGVILGVEKKRRTIGDKGDVVETSILNLKEGKKFHAIPLDEVRELELKDEKLREELDQALAALVQSRDQDKKAVSISFTGRGERHVRIGYVVETPVWKTSYRLVLGEANGPAGDKAGPTTRPGPGPANQPASDHTGKIQGWAIIENQTDTDWKDVQLSLVSGRPISFVEDLYHSLYLPRPVVQPSFAASLVPQTYENGMTREEMEKLHASFRARDLADAPDLSLNSGAPATQPGAPTGETNHLFGQAEMDPMASVVAAASAGRVGELFQYTVGSVSLPRQRSAMIPIVTDDVEVERVSIFNASVLADHPLHGARLKNTTHKHLLEGPVTVIDGAGYAGDARLSDLPPGQKRLISYGIDQEVLVDATPARNAAVIQTARLLKGVLNVTQKELIERTYLADNKSFKTKVLVIEHPRETDWKLSSPATADETTDNLYRFTLNLAAHQVSRLDVVTERTDVQVVQIRSVKPEELQQIIVSNGIPKPVRDAADKAIDMERGLIERQQQVEQLKVQLADLTAEQSRIRENMKSVAEKTDYYARLLKKLDAQETVIESTQSELKDSMQKVVQQRQELEKYLAGLDI